jgi:hypothetical protein
LPIGDDVKKMSREEFYDRLNAVAEAKRIFIDSGITNNITVAFEMYQKTIAERERPLVLDSKIEEAHRGPDFGPPYISLEVDIELEKPTCPDCGAVLAMRGVTATEKQQGYKSCWVCQDPKCRYEGLSDKSPMWWYRNLPEKGQENVTVESGAEKKDVSGG